MSDPASPASPAPATGTSTAAPSGSGNEPKYVTAEALQKIEERLAGQSQYIAKLEKQLKEHVPAEPTPKPDDSLTKRVKELEAENNRVKEREARQREREAISQIADSLINQGVDPDFARRQAKLVHSENKDKFTVTGENDSPAVKDGDKEVAVPAWMEAYLQTDEGRPLLPPKRNPTSNGLNGRTDVVVPTSARKVSRADMQAGRVSPEDIRTGKAVVI